MQGFFKWSGLVVFGMVVLVVAAYCVSRWIPMPTEDEKALAWLDAPRPLAGTNGFAALWSLPFDIPVADAERLLELAASGVRRKRGGRLVGVSDK